MRGLQERGVRGLQERAERESARDSCKGYVETAVRDL